ncbi:MAG: hypothetical protein EBU90_00365 [Proteobacteria bacterium]|nr:hypothetical protein [Pseudomonadota bacterium]NBP12884.1 hypothetical protein [bacterium]
MSLQINQQPVQFNSTLTVLSSVNLLGSTVAAGSFEAPYGNVLHSTYSDATLSALNADFADRADYSSFAVAASGSNGDFYVDGFYYGDGSKLSNVNGALGYNQGGAGNNIVPSKGNNTISSGTYSGILGGQKNTMQNKNSFIVGSNVTTTQDNTTFVENLFALSAIYGGGNEVVMSDGSNDDGHGENTLTISFSSGIFINNNLNTQSLSITGINGMSSYFILTDSTGKGWKFGTTTAGQLTALGAA